MRLNNKGVLLCLALAGCVGGRGAPPSTMYPPDGDMPRAADSMPVVPPPQTAAPSAADDPRDGPPPSTGPSGTSDRGPGRFDEVGFASVSAEPGYVARLQGAPPGGFVEVTSLQTGRAALAIVAPGAPPPDALVELSPAIAAAVGATGRAGVRVRRVMPSLPDQTELMNGRPAGPRLDTPPALLAGLRARLGSPAVASPPPRKVVTRAPTQPSRPATDRPKAVTPAGPGFYVQIAAFSTADRATALARSLGGAVSPAGSLYRVRLGPYATPDAAAKARAGAAARGYPDARVVRDN